MENEEEIWKDIPGYERLYQVSSLGRVKSLCGGRCHLSYDIILRPCITRKGYHLVWLYKNRCRKGKSIHILVANSFIPNILNKPQINHKDGIKSNNCVDNLEYNTQVENMQHSVRAGLRDGMSGENHFRSKLKEVDIPIIRQLKKDGFNMSYIGKKFNVNVATIRDVLVGRTWHRIK